MTELRLVSNTYRAPAKSGAGIGVPEYQADTPPLRGFFVSKKRMSCYGRSVWGAFGPAGPGTGNANLHGSLSLIGVRGCGVRKRIPGLSVMTNPTQVAPATNESNSLEAKRIHAQLEHSAAVLNAQIQWSLDSIESTLSILSEYLKGEVEIPPSVAEKLLNGSRAATALIASNSKYIRTTNQEAASLIVDCLRGAA